MRAEIMLINGEFQIVHRYQTLAEAMMDYVPETYYDIIERVSGHKEPFLWKPAHYIAVGLALLGKVKYNNELDKFVVHIPGGETFFVLPDMSHCTCGRDRCAHRLAVEAKHLLEELEWEQ